MNTGRRGDAERADRAFAVRAVFGTPVVVALLLGAALLVAAGVSRAGRTSQRTLPVERPAPLPTGGAGATPAATGPALNSEQQLVRRDVTGPTFNATSSLAGTRAVREDSRGSWPAFETATRARSGGPGQPNGNRDPVSSRRHAETRAEPPLRTVVA